jgi:type I restriction enzyme S subunit
MAERIAFETERLRLRQWKSADRLSSIDGLIALEVPKHDTLKSHQKGLKQQLFPVSDEVRK